MSKKVGLALSSGGWRGLAHIGVIKALLDANIPINYIAGCSTGALIGGLYLYLKDINLLTDIINELSYRDFFKTLIDPTLSQGLVKGRRYESVLKRYIPVEAKIRHLSIPFSATSTELYTGKTVYFDKGSLLKAIRASTAVPIIFSPFRYKEKLYIDGGVSTVVPVQKTKDMGADIVIAVNLYGKIFPIDKYNRPPKILKKFRKTTRLTGYGVTRIANFSLLHHLAAANCQTADIIISPPVEKNNFSIFSGFLAHKDTIDIGYKETQKHIPDIKKLLQTK